MNNNDGCISFLLFVLLVYLACCSKQEVVVKIDDCKARQEAGE